MTPDERRAELDRVANERAPSLTAPLAPITLNDLHRRITALENHPALNPMPALNEESNG